MTSDTTTFSRSLEAEVQTTPSAILRAAAARLREHTKRPIAAEPIAHWLEDEAWHVEGISTVADTTPAFRNGPLHFAHVILARRP